MTYYDGPIEPGMGFIWEPTLPHARALLIVTHVDDKMVFSLGEWQGVNLHPEDENYNEVERFREAVVRCCEIDDPDTAAKVNAAKGRSPA